jgi:spore coat protein U-like protein
MKTINWRRVLGSLVFFAACLLTSVPSFAAVTCSVSATSITSVYDPTVATENISTGRVTVSCTRLATDANTFAYTINANNGLQPTGSTNRAQRGATTNRYSYELFRQTPYTSTNRWQAGATTRMSGTVNFGASLTATDSKPFDLRIPGSQTVVTAGTYTDTVTITVLNSTATVTLNTNAFSVTVITTNSCQLSTPPGNMNFTYTSFQAAAAAANTTFQARCTSAFPYTLALDATSGTLLGLNYTLSLSAAGATGTGVVQSFTISGSIAGGQAGTCASATCNGSQTRTLTVSY